jgi:hypothetical protein
MLEALAVMPAEHAVTAAAEHVVMPVAHAATVVAEHAVMPVEHAAATVAAHAVGTAAVRAAALAAVTQVADLVAAMRVVAADTAAADIGNYCGFSQKGPSASAGGPFSLICRSNYGVWQKASHAASRK